MSNKSGILSSKKSNAPTRRRGMSISVYVFFLLLVLSIVPMMIISFINLQNVQKRLASMELEYEEDLLQLLISPVEARINTYEELIRFVSQLPAVMEILDQGENRAGSINKENAYDRYRGVIIRAFHKYPDIVNIQIFNTTGEEYLRIERQVNRDFYVKTPASSLLNNDPVFSKAGCLKEGDIFVVPKVIDAQSAENEGVPRLLLRIVIPISLEGETIGIYMSDVDVGVLSQSFPSVHWVFSDGSYLSAQTYGKTAFELFPGLEEVFISGQPSLYGNEPTLAWRPLYQSGVSDLVLWAGQEVRQDAVNITKKQIYLGIYITSAILGLVVLFVAFLISFRTQCFFTVLLDSLEGVILHKAPSVKTKYVIFSEVGKFTYELERLTETYKQMEFEREEALESLHQNEQLLLSVTNAVQSAVMLIDETGCVQFFNPAAEQMFGYSQEEMLGRKLHEVITPERFHKTAQAGLTRFFATGEGAVLKNPLELIALCKDGTELPIELYVGKVRKNGQWWAVGAAIDISERKIKEQALTRLAATDQLTGVSNRRNFVMLAEQELKRCRRYQIPIFFLMFDLDYFKRINDTFGHSTGDAVLRYFTNICTSLLRDSDLFGRIGGEEFASVLVNLDKEKVLNVAERIRAAFDHITIKDSGHIINLDAGVSIGVADTDIATDTVESALKRADSAMYQAKEQGRNRVVFRAL